MQSRETRISLLIVSFIILMVCFLSQKIRLDQKFLAAQNKDFRIADAVFLPPNQVLSAMTLGYDAFAADLIFMEANSYFMNHLTHDRQYKWLDNYLAALMGYCSDEGGHRWRLPPEDCQGQGFAWLDGVFPFNPRVYLWASQVVKFGHSLTDEVVDLSVYYGKTGIYYCPDAWELYLDVGFNLYFEYKSRENQEVRKREALDSYFAVAASLPGSQVDPNFLATMYWNRGEAELAIRQTYLTYYKATQRQRAELRTRLQGFDREDLAQQYEAEEQAWKSCFPYVPDPLLHTLGRPAIPGDGGAMRGGE